MTVTFTLTTSSTAAGPFNISGTTSGGALNGVLIATDISKETLLTGHPISNISETITGGTIASTGTCTTTTPWDTTPATPTPTPSPSPTPTGLPSYSYQIGPSYTQAQAGLACSRLTGSDGEIQDFLTEVFAATDQAANVVQFFTDSNLTTGFAGEGGTHAYQKTTGGVTDYTGQVSANGFVTDRTVCPT